ncbi:DUF5988 family protein [Kutzneria sp. NPDC052558]|uniref:DUF5988 family protein n=1 Tax=Kutzneria sp. NPDC052558 TaxID=3364121 RepID=UPI0037C52342
MVQRTVLLEGGPVDLPAVATVTVSHPLPDRITVDHFARHEHFEFTGGHDDAGGGHPVFRWLYSTAIAE